MQIAPNTKQGRQAIVTNSGHREPRRGAERIRRILHRAAAAQNQPPEARRHLDRLASV
jgi:hypothetical protein